jgi:general secretion pathway protein F
MSATTLDDLTALNAEIAALVRAGIPLEPALAALGADMPGRLGQMASALAEQTAGGKPLDEALAAHAVALPASYRAVVLAGMKAGRLPAALEAVATAARRIAETQRTAVVAFSYPLLVFALAWAGMAVFSRTLAVSLAASYYSLGMPGVEGIAGYRFLAAIAWTGQWAWYWGTLVPAAVLLLVAAWWYACTRAAALQAGWAAWLLTRLPWLGRVLQWTRTAVFLDMLALMVENHAPLDEALTLAALASGDPNTQRAARRWIESLGQGRAQPAGGGDFPPLVEWLMRAAGRDGALLPALRHAAATYHRRARHQAELACVMLPALLTAVIAGSIVAVYALMLFLPYTMLLKALGGL